MPAGDLILMGPPGSGKGTQARILERERGWVQISTGELFRDHVRRQSELGRRVQGYLERGEYVPDEVTIDIVRQRLADVPEAKRAVFDGFPRTVAQAEALDRLLAEFGRAVATVVMLDAPRDEVVARLSGRAQAEGRTDDTPAVIGRRLDVYEDRTRPVIEHYERRGLLKRVDGLGSVEEIGGRLRGAIG